MPTATDEILPLLPSLFFPHAGEPVPPGLIGSRIVAIGTFAQPQQVDGGGLVIDFVPAGDSEVHRVVLAFTELGMWVHRTATPADGVE